MKICIIGAGWYGSHLALVLKKAGHDVTVVDRNDEIFKGVSGDRGIRLHTGPHYPRSEETRKGCHINYKRFLQVYPELVVRHQYSIYGLGDKDADDAPSKVDEHKFDAVCTENKGILSRKIDPQKWGYQHLITAYDIDEPSIVGGRELREAFSKYLKDAGVKVVCNFNVTKLEKTSDGVNVSNGKTTELFELVINATCFENLLPTKSLPFEMEAIYQPCLALVYRDKLETVSKPPISFIVMDGMNPCMMPFDKRYNGPVVTNDKGEAYRVYMMTHGKWTIMASCTTYAKAQDVLKEITDEFINTRIKPNCEAHMKKFWPEFEGRFEYLHWTGSVLAKIKTEKEFRGAFSFAEKERPVVHVFPGKVGCIFNVADEVLKLIENNKKDIIEYGDYKYVKDGVLDKACGEVTEKPDPSDTRNTCHLQTYRDLVSADSTQTDSLKGLMGVINSNGHPIWSPSLPPPQSPTQQQLSTASTKELNTQFPPTAQSSSFSL